jgi:hypothetical protein
VEKPILKTLLRAKKKKPSPAAASSPNISRYLYRNEYLYENTYDWQKANLEKPPTTPQTRQ